MEPNKTTHNQIIKIHIAIKDLGLSDDDYRTVLCTQFKAKSCKELTVIQAAKLLAHFERLGWKPKRASGSRRQASGPEPEAQSPKPRVRRPQGGNVIYLANEGQKWKILYFARDLGWIAEDELFNRGMSAANNSPRLKGFIQRQTGGKKSTLARLTSNEASGIIDAFKDMLKGDRGERRSAVGGRQSAVSNQRDEG